MTTRGALHKVRAGVGPGLHLLVLLAASPASGQAPPPDGDWRTVESEHFRVTYPADMEAEGLEVAARAERAWKRLSEVFVEPPGGRTDILLTDHVDLSNGSARVAPRKEVTIHARPPVEGSGLSHFDDWLELVLVHELVHVFHLDTSGGLGDALRAVFGRVPAQWPFFPQWGTPRWTVEGLATWYESALTGSGRVRGTYHDMILRTAALEGGLEEIDEASGESPVWPGGQRPYVYGSQFFEHLTDEHGAERTGDFVRAVAGQLVPYRLDAAAREGFGTSFSDAWRAWQQELVGEARALAEARASARPVTVTEPVTRGARFAVHPRVSPDGTTLVYARADGRSDAQLRRVAAGAPPGTGSRELTRTNGAAAFDFMPGGDVVFSQLEAAGPYRMYGDLWRVDGGGRVRRLTRGARLDHPSVGPEGREAVAVRTGGGTTWLVAVDLETGEVDEITPPDPAVHWAFPAVSPDGRRIAAARWTEGAYFDVVVLDRGTGEVVEVTRDRALDTAPAWSPDGRWLVWSSDRSGVPDVLAASLDPATGRPGPVRQVTNLPTGTHFPTVSPDGRWLHLSVHHAEGWEIERTPFEPDAFFDPFPLDARFVPPGSPDTVATVEVPEGLEPDDYDALRTLAPGYWEPVFAPSVRTSGYRVVEPSWGLRTTAEDVVGRHAAALQLLLSTDGRPSGGLGWTWRGLGNPLLSVRATQGWDAAGPGRFVSEDDTIPFLVRERERSASLAATFRRVRFRHALALTLAGGMVWEHRDLLDLELEPSVLTLTRPGARLADGSATVEWSNVRGHAFSTGLEKGLALAVTGRARRELDVPSADRGSPGRDRSLREGVALLRLYEDLPGPGFADHVVALRAAAGLARGPGADRFHYDVGGGAGEAEPVTGFGLFGGGAYLFPVRGFDNGDRHGRQAWSASLEYRVPLALVGDGPGLFPLYVDRLSGALFLDGGDAWGPDSGAEAAPRPDPLASAGAELVAELVTFFSIPVTLRAGVAARLSGGEGLQAYVRFGRWF